MILLLLMGLGAAGVKAQVRIGGNASPNPAAVLDLNATDDATPAGNKGALALPRVSLASTATSLNGVTPTVGMLVFNTNAALGTGVYYWNGSGWVNTNYNYFIGSDSITGLSSIKTGDRLVYDGSKWTLVPSPTIETWDLQCTQCGSAPVGQINMAITLPAGCSTANTWEMTAQYREYYGMMLVSNTSFAFNKLVATAAVPHVRLACLHL